MDMFILKWYLSMAFIISLISCAGSQKQVTKPEVSGQELNTVQKSAVQKIKELDHKPVEERVALYKKLKMEHPDMYSFENEDEITMYGYGFLWGDKLDEALVIFQLIVDEFGSANSYDSLGEAYLKKGNTVASLENYEKSLAMNPENFNAEDQIEKIKFPHKKPLTPAEKFSKVYTIDQYRSDLDQLYQSVVKIHPNIYKFISAKDFEKLVKESKSQITDETTFSEFSYLCNKIIAAISCAHTGMGGLYPEHEMLPQSLKFPMQTRWIDGHLYVIDPMGNKENIKPKDEILTINGVPVAKVMENIYQHIVAQGSIQTTKNHVFNTLSSSLIPYALGLPERYEVTLNHSKQVITLKPSDKPTEPYWDHLQYCQEQLCFKLMDDQKTALMTIASFNYYDWNNLQEFIDFVDQSFKEIERKGIKNLIIDVRYNGGGSQSAAIYLLRHLISKPFTYYSKAESAGKEGKSEWEDVNYPMSKVFQGKLLFLIDGIGNSTTGHFMSLVKEWKLGTIIGEELGSNQFCNAGSTSCRLKNTKITYYVANNTHISTATSLPDEKGIMPDHFIHQNIDDVINKKDVVKEFALGLLK